MRLHPALLPSRGERAVRAAVLVYVVILIAAPLLVLAGFGVADGPGPLWGAVSTAVAASALWLTFWTATVVAAANAVLGTATAWVLVRYRVPGKALVSALIDLPFAIPTLVTGLMLAVLYGKDALAGRVLAVLGVQVMFAPLGIALALAFITLPFVVRAVEPVLLEIDLAEEEAAAVLGAGPWRTFRTVFWPALAPAAVSGAIRSLGRALGEFGSVVVVAGNIPQRTLTAPVLVFGEIESGAPQTAAAVSLVLLVSALALHGLASAIERRAGSHRG